MKNNHVTVFYRNTVERKKYGPMIESICSSQGLTFTYVKRIGELDENNMKHDRRFIILGHNQEKPVASKIFPCLKKANHKLIICSINNLPEKLDLYKRYQTGIIFTDGQDDAEIKKQIEEAFKEEYDVKTYINPEALLTMRVYEKVKDIIKDDLGIEDIDALFRALYLKSINVSISHNKGGNSQGYQYILKHSGNKRHYTIDQKRAQKDLQMLGSVIAYYVRSIKAAQKENDSSFNL